MSRFTKALVVLGAVSLVTCPVVASAAGSSLAVRLVGTTKTKDVEGAWGVIEIGGVILVGVGFAFLLFKSN